MNASGSSVFFSGLAATVVDGFASATFTFVDLASATFASPVFVSATFATSRLVKVKTIDFPSRVCATPSTRSPMRIAVQRNTPSLASASPGKVKPTRSRSKSTCSAAYFLGSNGFAATATAAASATGAAGFASATFASATAATGLVSATFASATGAVGFVSATFASTTAAAGLASPAAVTLGAKVSKLITFVSGSKFPANSSAALFNVHGPLKPKITGS